MNARAITNSETVEDQKNSDAFTELTKSVYAALETYSNVHRGSGHNSMATTYLYEQAREVILEQLRLDKEKHAVVFCSPGRAELLKQLLKSKHYQCLSSQEIGLPLGIRALVVDKAALPGGIPFQTGGGTARLVGPGWVIWARGPDRFEAGTPAIINVIAFARALQLVQHYGKDAFQHAEIPTRTAGDILYRDELEQYTGRKMFDELRKTLIGQRVPVPTIEGIRPFINLDNGASRACA